MQREYLKLIFSEIIEGYSFVPSKLFGDLKIKHINNFDAAKTDIKNHYYFEKAVSQGLEKREDKIDYLIKEKLWDPEKDKQAKRLEDMLKGMRKTKSKLILQTQIDAINKDIEENELQLSAILAEKETIIGFTAEEYAQRRINEYYMYISILDENGNRLFKEDEFQELDEEQVAEIMTVYSKNNEKFKAEVLKKIALADFFTNIFYLCEDNVFNFYGKPVINLTFYQIEIYSYGRYFKSLIQNSEDKIPDHIVEDPDKLIEWAQSSKNVKEVLEKNSGEEAGASSIMGATKEDLAKAGVNQDQDVIDLSKKAEEQGGRLSMDDLMKLHGAK
tara:strand:- start:1222 stop:2214 length:993 start_codon:yes stop_codon:yes gene_type:complete